MRGAIVQPIADLEGIYSLDHRVAEFVVDGLVDVDAFQAQADLARVQSINANVAIYRDQSVAVNSIAARLDELAVPPFRYRHPRRQWLSRCRHCGHLVSVSVEGSGLRPYSSKLTLFKVLLALCVTSFPVAGEPVKLILSMPGWLVMSGPKLSSPLNAWTTPGGKTVFVNSASFRLQ